ncbi:unnamed protein product [Lasius platythorax]|uniref:Apoptosis 1 inhibitor n=1 Tax=Lasius platythorax TaxID=488582 RepID=A0AAV2NXW2_9HYME
MSNVDYRYEIVRLDSFKNWTISEISDEEQAESGFYCTGHLDQVICFYCGVGLMDWDDTMEPWKMHYRWASKCFYVLKIKGQDYLQHPYENIYEKEKKLVHYSSPEMQLAGFGMKTQDPQNSHSNIENITSSILTLSIKDKKVENKDFDKLYDAKASSKSSDKEESKLICKVCSLKERNILFLPCGKHNNVCQLL